MNLKENVVAEIRELGNKYGVEKIVLFGSRARGDHQLKSDIDLAVFPGQNFGREGEFSAEIDELDTLLKIDLVFVTAEIDARLLKLINQEGTVLYAHETK